MQPLEFFTVKEYVLFAARPTKVAVSPTPVMVTPPGNAVIVHVPGVGKPLSFTLPVATLHVG